MTILHIKWTRFDETRCIVIDCPTCKRMRRASAQNEDWYGWYVVCAGCGDRWTDGEMHDRPFAPGWRKQNREYARRVLADIGMTA